MNTKYVRVLNFVYTERCIELKRGTTPVRAQVIKNTSIFCTPALYSILVEGLLDESWAERLAGMHIQTMKKKNKVYVTTLSGRLTDQAELLGVLNTLYNLKMALLAIKRMD